MFLLRLSVVQYTYAKFALVPWVVFLYSGLIIYLLFVCFFVVVASIEHLHSCRCFSLFTHYLVSSFKSFIYSWCLNNIHLNCAGPLIHGFFSVVNTTVYVVQLHYLQLVKCVDMEPRMQRTVNTEGRLQVIHRFPPVLRVGVPSPHVIQVSTVLWYSLDGASRHAPFSFDLGFLWKTAWGMGFIIASILWPRVS